MTIEERISSTIVFDDLYDILFIIHYKNLGDGFKPVPKICKQILATLDHPHIFSGKLTYRSIKQPSHHLRPPPEETPSIHAGRLGLGFPLAERKGADFCRFCLWLVQRILWCNIESYDDVASDTLFHTFLHLCCTQHALVVSWACDTWVAHDV